MGEATCMSKMAWETMYSDASGIEYAVRYDANQNTNEGVGAIEFENCGKVQFPHSKIDWLIDCLQKIKDEQGI